jgi:peptidoglycan/xylan/chitin deacetylase (PgdA/CDA1 family)
VSRRAVLRGALLTGAGAATALVAADQVKSWCGLDQPPVTGGYAAAADNLAAVTHGGVEIRYYARTTEPLVAFTFDDGPAPHWTPDVLDVLDDFGVPATFFLVGRNLERHAGLLRGRLDRHEVGNHSWSHADLATLDLAAVHSELERTHEAILRHTGRTVTLLRPPFGHLGGSTVLAADRMGYRIALWSHAMRERHYRHNPDGLVAEIVDTVRPGAMVLAHDAGDDRRLVTIRGLGAMITGLRRRGFRLVTVSELLAAEETDRPGRQAAGPISEVAY